MTRSKEATKANLVVHIVFRFDYGGLENGVANLVNSLSGESLRHAIVVLTEATEFSRRLSDDVQVFTLGKKPGKDPAAYVRLYKLLRRLKPAIVHTRNIGTLDCSFIAFLARVPVRIHGEHGWDVYDPDGTHAKYRWLRRIFSRFVYRFVTVSDDLRAWLIAVIGISEEKVKHICNGVDTQRFQPATLERGGGTGGVVIGSVTRFSPIKDPLNLVEAFIMLHEDGTAACKSAKLVMIGDGELHGQALDLLREANLESCSWLPGSRDDIPEQLRSMDVFVLGSLREGISNTILEAMAAGLPVIATNTGGNGELVQSGVTGMLVPPADTESLASALANYVADSNLREEHGRASWQRVIDEFSINVMVQNYKNLYNGALAAKGI